jgi:hypothetical protein
MTFTPTFGGAMHYAMVSLTIEECRILYKENYGIRFEGNLRLIQILEITAELKFGIDLQAEYKLKTQNHVTVGV